MQLPSHFIRFCDLDKHDLVQVLSVQHGVTEQMSLQSFQDIYLDERQEKRLRYKEWYDVMSINPEEAWPDMEWLLVIKDEQVCQVIP